MSVPTGNGVQAPRRKPRKPKRESLNVGDVVLDGQYEVVKVLHTAGMASVYLVSDLVLNKLWVLKHVNKAKATESAVAMLEYRSLIAEANIMKSLSHTGIARITSMRDDGDFLFIVMDFIDGKSMKNWLQERGTIPQRMAVSWMRSVAEIMLYLHNRETPILYNDMKPDNVMISKLGEVKVIDFGTGEVLTKDNVMRKATLGTKGYAAPEQAKKGTRNDLRSDIYAFGRTLFQLLTGLNPIAFHNKSLPSIVEYDATLSKGLDVVIQKCTAEDPEDRYDSFESVLYALRNYEKLDTGYRKKLKTKVRIVRGTFIVGLLTCVASLFPIIQGMTSGSSAYNSQLKAIEVSMDKVALLDLINSEPTVVSGFDVLLEWYTSDGKFTSDEESELTTLVAPLLADSGYKTASFAKEVGIAYETMYTPASGGELEYLLKKKKWFDLAAKSLIPSNEVKFYRSVVEFDLSVVQGTGVSGMYMNHWVAISDTILSSNEIGYYTHLSKLVNTYTVVLISEGVSESTLKSATNKAISFLDSFVPTTSAEESLKESLTKSFSGTLDKIASAGINSGGSK